MLWFALNSGTKRGAPLQPSSGERGARVLYACLSPLILAIMKTPARPFRVRHEDVPPSR